MWLTVLAGVQQSRPGPPAAQPPRASSTNAGGGCVENLWPESVFLVSHAWALRKPLARICVSSLSRSGSPKTGPNLCFKFITLAVAECEAQDEGWRIKQEDRDAATALTALPDAPLPLAAALLLCMSPDGYLTAAEALVRALRAATEADPRTTILNIDGVGAYDDISRASMLRALSCHESLAGLLPFGQPSRYIYYDERGGGA